MKNKNFKIASSRLLRTVSLIKHFIHTFTTIAYIYLKQKLKRTHHTNEVLEFLNNKSNSKSKHITKLLIKRNKYLHKIIIAVCIDFSAILAPTTVTLASTQLININILPIRANNINIADIKRQFKTANMIFENSGFNAGNSGKLKIRVKIVGNKNIATTDYSNLNTTEALYDLMGAKQKKRGFILSEQNINRKLKFVHDLRRKYQADIVVLFLSTKQKTDFCGLAPVIKKFDPRYGFAIVRIGKPCYGRNDQDLVHELGHLLGIAHSRRQTPKGGIFNYASGFGLDHKHVTVMAYMEIFSASKRLLRFADPFAKDCIKVCGDIHSNAVYTIQQTAGLISKFGENLNSKDMEPNFPNKYSNSNYVNKQSPFYYQGKIDYPGDIDTYKFKLKAGKTYTIKIHNKTQQQNHTLKNLSLLGLFDHKKRLISETKRFNNSEITVLFSPKIDTEYYLAIGGKNYDDQGLYKLEVKTTNNKTLIATAKNKLTNKNIYQQNIIDTSLGAIPEQYIEIENQVSH